LTGFQTDYASSILVARSEVSAVNLPIVTVSHRRASSKKDRGRPAARRAEHEAWLGEVEGIDLTLTRPPACPTPRCRLTLIGVGARPRRNGSDGERADPTAGLKVCTSEEDGRWRRRAVERDSSCGVSPCLVQRNFELRKVALSVCTRDYGTPCIHEHACVRCPQLRPDPAQMPRLEEIRANLVDRLHDFRDAASRR